MLFLRYYLWLAPHVLCGAAVVIAFRKKLHRRLPFFVTLLAFIVGFELIVSFPVSLFLPLSIYRGFLVFDIAATFLLELLVLFELSRELLFSHEFLARIFRPLPKWTAAVLVLIAAVFSALLPQTAQERVMNVFQTLNFALNFIAIGLLLAMLLFTRVLGISWRGIPAGIALGFGVLAAVEVAASPLMAQWGKGAYISVDLIRMAAFHICVLVWLAYLVLPERSPRFSGVQVSDLEVRIEELQRMVQR